MVRWIACLSGCAKGWPPGEPPSLVSSRIGAGELLSSSLFANGRIELLVRLARVFAHHSSDQQRADTDARRHYDGR
jgi:hypothetical protein